MNEEALMEQAIRAPDVFSSQTPMWWLSATGSVAVPRTRLRQQMMMVWVQGRLGDKGHLASITSSDI